MTINRKPLPQLPRDLTDAGYPGATYRAAYNATLDGLIPAERGANGRWTYDPADLPQIAQALGLANP